MTPKVNIEEAKKKLSPEQYNVCFLKGTEPPGSGKYLHSKTKGMYVCAVCGKNLFASNTKYDSKTGWPSFWNFAGEESVKKSQDYSMVIPRTEVSCANCGAHLGHVFNDGPQPTGMRYCINSLALDFKPQKKD